MHRVPITIVTGFLGAGKTSLVRHLLQASAGRRIALLINEFGELGIDRELLLGCGAACPDDAMIELANGCICCTVAEDFLPALGGLLDRPGRLDHIVIETSGLALPKPLLQAFQWPEVKARVTVDGVVTVIDAAAFAVGAMPDPKPVHAAAHDDPLEEVFGDQLAASDLVVLNKIDLVADDTLDRIVATMAARLRPGVRLVRAARGAVSPLVLLGLGAEAEDDLASRPSCHDLEAAHDHDDFESFVVDRGPVDDPVGFARTLGELIATHRILRLKGFLDVPDFRFRQVLQAVGPRIERYFDRPWRADEDRRTRVVVIGLKGLDRAAIAAALAD
ncbi:MAG TPA: cobalamin biosynthesis protein CobW [Stellaceae bacterium]|nr:cobalamin biosynthesis protein CobW [Stellaceae bacterium]